MSVPENMHDAADGRAGPSAEAALREAERASQAPEKIAQVAPGLLEEDFQSVISALQLLGEAKPTKSKEQLEAEQEEEEKVPCTRSRRSCLCWRQDANAPHCFDR